MELAFESFNFSQDNIPSFLKYEKENKDNNDLNDLKNSGNNNSKNNKDNSNSNKFKKFITIFSSLYPKSATKIQTSNVKSLEQIEVEQKALLLLKGNDFVNFSKLLKYGYEMPDEQKKMFSDKMTSLLGKGRFTSDFNTGLINSMIGNGAILPLETIQSIFFKTNFDIFCLDYLLKVEQEKADPSLKNKSDELLKNHTAENRGHVVKAISDFTASIDNKRILFDNWKDLVKTYLYTEKNSNSTYFIHFSSLLRFFNYFNQVVIPSASPEEINETFQLLSLLKKEHINNHDTDEKKQKNYSYHSELSQLDKFLNSLNVVPTEFSNDKIKNLIEATKNIYMQKRLQSIALERQSAISEKINTKYLPVDTKLMVEKIEKIFEKINSEKTLLEQDTILEMERIMFQKTPKILQQYLSLDDEFKTTMKNHNQQTPKDLLDIALNDILAIFNQLNEQLNYNKMTDLSVSQKHVNKLKGSF